MRERERERERVYKAEGGRKKTQTLL